MRSTAAVEFDARMTSPLARLALVLLCLSGPTVQAQESETPLSFEQAVELALARNPSLAAARLDIQVARSRIDVARERPNPDLTLESQKETPRESLGLAFPIETADKRDRRVRVAEAQASTSEAALAQRALGLRGDVRRAYYALVAAELHARQARALAELAARVRSAAAERFEAGAAPRLELLQMDLAAGQTENEFTFAEAAARAARTELNVLLLWPPSRATIVDGDLGAGDVPAEEAAVDRALAASADIALLERGLAEQQARVELARAGQWPDPVLEGTVTHRAPPEFDWGWRGVLTVSLPLFHHHGAEVRVEEADLARLRAEREALVAKLRGSVASKATVASAERERYLRYRDRMLPQADEVERMAEDSYRSGQTGLVAMLQAVQAVREVRTRATDTGLAFQIVLADLEQAIGAPLP